MDGGKGSAPRPFSVPREVFEQNRERIWPSKPKPRYVPPPLPQNEQDEPGKDNGAPL